MTTLPTLPNKTRRYFYPFALALVYLLWTSHMFLADRWHIFTNWWPMSLTMVLGSFVAGASAEGGAAVAFPVFTKLLHISAPEARTFGLMIQSAGMTIIVCALWFAAMLVYRHRFVKPLVTVAPMPLTKPSSQQLTAE
ncbi:MAG: hypothetical protein R2932_29290 [Caldilineaceae bacterium]